MKKIWSLLLVVFIGCGQPNSDALTGRVVSDNFEGMTVRGSFSERDVESDGTFEYESIGVASLVTVSQNGKTVLMAYEFPNEELVVDRESTFYAIALQHPYFVYTDTAEKKAIVGRIKDSYSSWDGSNEAAWNIAISKNMPIRSDFSVQGHYVAMCSENPMLTNEGGLSMKFTSESPMYYVGGIFDVYDADLPDVMHGSYLYIEPQVNIINFSVSPPVYTIITSEISFTMPGNGQYEVRTSNGYDQMYWKDIVDNPLADDLLRSGWDDPLNREAFMANAWLLISAMISAAGDLSAVQGGREAVRNLMNNATAPDVFMYSSHYAFRGDYGGSMYEILVWFVDNHDAIASAVTSGGALVQNAGHMDTETLQSATGALTGEARYEKWLCPASCNWTQNYHVIDGVVQNTIYDSTPPVYQPGPPKSICSTTGNNGSMAYLVLMLLGAAIFARKVKHEAN